MTIGQQGVTRYLESFVPVGEIAKRDPQRERNTFVSHLQTMAKDQRIRVTFVTGDVHCAAVGLFKTLVPGKKGSPVPPEQDHRYMLDITTSELRR